MYRSSYPSMPKFQFHKGTIKTKYEDVYDDGFLISIP